MAHQFSDINYFPVSVHFCENEKIEIIEAEFGLRGLAIVFKLLFKIYKESFYYKWNETSCRMFVRRLGGEVDDEFMQRLVESLVEQDFFDKELYARYGILTSKGIQTRYFDITARRKNQLPFPAEYILIDVSKYKYVTLSSLNAAACCTEAPSTLENAAACCTETTSGLQAAAKTGQKKEKEKKGKERKRNSERESAQAREETFSRQCETWRKELLEDRDWQAAFCRQVGVEIGFLKLLPEKVLEFEDFIICNAEEESLTNRQDYARRFHYWWLYHGRKKEAGGGLEYRNPAGRRPSRMEELQRVGEESRDMALKILNAG